MPLSPGCKASSARLVTSVSGTWSAIGAALRHHGPGSFARAGQTWCEALASASHHGTMIPTSQCCVVGQRHGVSGPDRLLETCDRRFFPKLAARCLRVLGASRAVPAAAAAKWPARPVRDPALSQSCSAPGGRPRPARPACGPRCPRSARRCRPLVRDPDVIVSQAAARTSPLNGSNRLGKRTLWQELISHARRPSAAAARAPLSRRSAECWCRCCSWLCGAAGAFRDGGGS